VDTAVLVEHNASITVVEEVVCPENGGSMFLQNVGNHLPNTQHNPENHNMIPTISLATTQQLALIYFFLTHGSVHHDSMLIKRSNLMQQYADIYLLQSHSTCFGHHSTHHPFQRGLIGPRWKEVAVPVS